jgi:hypothetical protein
MLLPMQSHPAQRTTIGQPLPNDTHGPAGCAAAGALGRGVEPSGFWDDLQKAVGIGGQIAGPLLGAFGI